MWKATHLDGASEMTRSTTHLWATISLWLDDMLERMGIDIGQR